MRTSVWLDDEEISEWFDLEQGLRQGRALAPLLFHRFFAAVLRFVLRRFGKDLEILVDSCAYPSQAQRERPRNRESEGRSWTMV